MVNVDDAAARGVHDDDLIRVFNDVGSFQVRAKVAANVKPGQIVSYNGWAGFQYKDWGGRERNRTRDGEVDRLRRRLRPPRSTSPPTGSRSRRPLGALRLREGARG